MSAPMPETSNDHFAQRSATAGHLTSLFTLYKRLFQMERPENTTRSIGL